MSEIEAFPSLAKILINIILPKDVEHIKGFGQICFSSFKHNVFSGCLTKDWILLTECCSWSPLLTEKINFGWTD